MPAVPIDWLAAGLPTGSAQEQQQVCLAADWCWLPIDLLVVLAAPTAVASGVAAADFAVPTGCLAAVEVRSAAAVVGSIGFA